MDIFEQNATFALKDSDYRLRCRMDDIRANEAVLRSTKTMKEDLFILLRKAYAHVSN